MRLLIVEDDQGLREIMGILCVDHWGINHCQFAETMDEAIAQLKKGKPDLIFLDFLLGTEISTPIIEYVRKTYPKDPPKIVVISAMNGAEKVVKKYKINDFIKKPFDLETIEKYIK